MDDCKVGLTGLAVMGQNLVLNMAGHGCSVAVHNRTTETAENFMKERVGSLPVKHGRDLEEFVSLIERPRNIMIMVKAGAPVDDTIEKLLPLLDKDDMICDMGNSYFKDTERRAKMLDEKGIHYMGIGVSGGEEGALRGPSIMPGGPSECYERIKGILESVAAVTDSGPCVTHTGPGGAGHYVKMVHNGLEYGDMQMIAEIYHFMKETGMDSEAIADAFEFYNKGELSSYLVEITALVLREKDPDTGGPLAEMILDRAGQKGTGSWTSASGLELGVPVPSITSAVEARSLSAIKKEREEASGAIKVGPKKAGALARDPVDLCGKALYAARIVLYSQGIALLRSASSEYGYGLDIRELARIWKGGCIIRSGLLDRIMAAWEGKSDPASLLVDPSIIQAMEEREASLREFVITAAERAVPCPSLSASLAYFDGYRSERLPANLIQAQRDYFGAHTFERIDKGGSFHHKWGEDH